MDKVRVFCPGKINLSLNILGRTNGMHLVDSIMQSISLGDYITVAPRIDSKVNITFIGQRIEVNNTVEKTVGLLKEKFGDFGADIIVEKNIPIAGGLGGSSADSSGALLALDRIYDFSKRGLDLFSTAKLLGSDVSFMLLGGCARVTGTGELITLLDNRLKLDIVIARIPSALCQSGDVYREFDSLVPEFISAPTDNDTLASLLQSGDSSAIELFDNALTHASESLSRAISTTLKSLKEHGAINAVMSGSGSCCVGYFDCEKKAKLAEQKLKKAGFYSIYCKTL